MITSQLPIKAWHDVIGEPTFADAILDRIVHNAYRLELEGRNHLRGCRLPHLHARTGSEAGAHGAGGNRQDVYAIGFRAPAR